GALACRVAGFDAQAVLIPEPFGPTMLTAQPGVLWFRVSVRGRATHVLQAGAGANAIEKCWPLIKALRDLEAEMNREPRPGPWEAMEHPIHLNVGRIQGGDWPSTVAAEAFFEARLAFLPPTGFKDTAERIRLCVARAAVADPWHENHPPQVEFFGFRSKGHVVSGTPEPFRVLADCHRSLAGSAPEIYTATCTTDLRAFFLSGPSRATCFGPVAENIHGPDERVRLDSVLYTASVYALFLARWCGLTE
ncbi:MAG: M20/M25/M40 family metallo-hydrolase, partial [Deltaproteobacteria bacterium]|nr:M20/M25/M40 family metallo-hydrolase [Deltaproteobacteria bacterium]